MLFRKRAPPRRGLSVSETNFVIRNLGAFIAPDALDDEFFDTPYVRTANSPVIL